jgi:hypothetical protein
VARGESGARLLVRLAGQMQDFFHESAGAWGEARPPCPGHSHPARPEVLDGGAWWTCPADGRRIARVGALPCPPRRLACRAWSGSRS